MRPRTPTFIWIPFLFSIGGISWAFLLAALAILSALILAPAIRDTRAAEIQRNNLLASLQQDDQKIALQKEFLAAASDPLVLQRLAARSLNIQRPISAPSPSTPTPPNATAPSPPSSPNASRWSPPSPCLPSPGISSPRSPPPCDPCSSPSPSPACSSRSSSASASPRAESARPSPGVA